ncbi:unnamed protein product, partial [marine sediment metagenome]
GAIFNLMPVALVLIAVFFAIKAIVSVIVFALFLRYQDGKDSASQLLQTLKTYFKN